MAREASWQGAAVATAQVSPDKTWANSGIEMNQSLKEIQDDYDVL